MATSAGAKGWRLPSVAELASLVEPSNGSPALPAGIPVAGLPWLRNHYWSATTIADNPEYGWTVHFEDGGVQDYRKPLSALAWCVRVPCTRISTDFLFYVAGRSVRACARATGGASARAVLRARLHLLNASAEPE